MSVVCREATIKDREPLLDLFRVAFDSEASPGDWAWKYDRNPFHSISVAAFEGEMAVGFFGGIGTRYRGSQGNRPGTASGDVMTHPGWRVLGKRSLLKDLGETYKQLNAGIGIPFDFGFPHERARKIEERVLGILTLERAGQLSSPFTNSSLFSGGKLRRAFQRILIDETFSTPHEALAEVIHSRPGWRSDRSPASLNWRFHDRPGVKYRTFQLLGLSGKSRGYAVTRTSNDAALLVDFQLRDEDSGDLPALLFEVAKHQDPETRVFRIRLPRRSFLFERLKSEFGFLTEESDTHLVARVFEPGFDLVNPAPGFDYRFSDHDVF